MSAPEPVTIRATVWELANPSQPGHWPHGHTPRSGAPDTCDPWRPLSGISANARAPPTSPSRRSACALKAFYGVVKQLGQTDGRSTLVRPRPPATPYPRGLRPLRDPQPPARPGILGYGLGVRSPRSVRFGPRKGSVRRVGPFPPPLPGPRWRGGLRAPAFPRLSLLASVAAQWGRAQHSPSQCRQMRTWGASWSLWTPPLWSSHSSRRPRWGQSQHPQTPPASGLFLRSGNGVLSSFSRPHPWQRLHTRVGEGWAGEERLSQRPWDPPSAPTPHPHRRSASWRSQCPLWVFSNSPFRVSATDHWLDAVGWEGHSASSWLPQTSSLTVHLLPLSPAVPLPFWRARDAFSAAPSSLPYKRRPIRIFKEACFVHARWALSEPFPPGLPHILVCPSSKPQTLPAAYSPLLFLWLSAGERRGGSFHLQEVSTVVAGGLRGTVPRDF